MGRISGALNTTVGITSLFGVLGEALGIVPVLNIASAITGLTGLVALLFLPQNA